MPKHFGVSVNVSLPNSVSIDTYPPFCHWLLLPRNGLDLSFVSIRAPVARAKAGANGPFFVVALAWSQTCSGSVGFSWGTNRGQVRSEAEKAPWFVGNLKSIERSHTQETLAKQGMISRVSCLLCCVVLLLLCSGVSIHKSQCIDLLAVQDPL